MQYPLVTKKRADFELFKSVVEAMNRGEHLTTSGLEKIVSIRASINKGLTEELNKAFPNIQPAARPVVEVTENLNPGWLAGFSSAEGCFYVNIEKSSSTKTKHRVSIRFSLTQHEFPRDALLLGSIKKYWGCGSTYEEPGGRPIVGFVVFNYTDLLNIIIPFFTNYPVKGAKALEFQDFNKVAEIMKVNGHLTTEGLEQIRQIKGGMNTTRGN